MLHRHQQTPGTTLPETLGVGLQEKPPLDWLLSPKSYCSRGLGLYSRLGREDASLILAQGRETCIRTRPTRGLFSWGLHRAGSVCGQGFAVLCGQGFAFGRWDVPRVWDVPLERAHTSQALLWNAQEFRPAEDTRAAV